MSFPPSAFMKLTRAEGGRAKNEIVGERGSPDAESGSNYRANETRRHPPSPRLRRDKRMPALPVFEPQARNYLSDRGMRNFSAYLPSKSPSRLTASPV